MNLNVLGYEHWAASTGVDATCGADDCARVTAVDRGSCLVHDGQAELPAELAGSLLYATGDASELPCVGDWVQVRHHNDRSQAVIVRVLPRAGILRRRRPGGGCSAQMVAANLDLAFIVQSCEGDFNPKRLERALVMATEGGVEAVALLTKTDLAAPEDVRAMLARLEQAGARALAVSNETGEGLAAVRELVRPGRSVCLLGSSGVGKSSLINRLMGCQALRTGEVSGTREGRHTTTRRQLLLLPGGGLLIDTPGMREFGMADAEEAVGATFDEFTRLAAQCRYHDCAHLTEPGCAVRSALERGELTAGRYENYLKLRREAAHYAMSSLDRRRKDKAFGKMCKAVKNSMAD